MLCFSWTVPSFTFPGYWNMNTCLFYDHIALLCCTEVLVKTVDALWWQLKRFWHLWWQLGIYQVAISFRSFLHIQTVSTLVIVCCEYVKYCALISTRQGKIQDNAMIIIDFLMSIVIISSDGTLEKPKQKKVRYTCNTLT